MKFLHLRPRDDHGLPKKNGGTTVGYVPLEDRKLLVTFARCSENDVFNKHKAHLICIGRMAKGVKMVNLIVPEGQHRIDALKDAAAAYEKTILQNYGKEKRKA